jgi:hypothetical protein
MSTGCRSLGKDDVKAATFKCEKNADGNRTDCEIFPRLSRFEEAARTEMVKKTSRNTRKGISKENNVLTSDGSYRFTLGNEFTESRSQEGIIH